MALLPLSLALACSSDSGKKDSAVGEKSSEAASKRAKPAKAKVDPQQRLKAFLAMEGPASSEAIAWEHAVRNVALQQALERPEMAAPGPTGVPKAHMEVGGLDVATMKGEAKAHWAKSWEPASDCTSTEIQKPPFAPLPDGAEKALPEPMQSALSAIADATHFSVTCDEGRAYDISIAKDGRVVLLVDNSELDLEELLEENRFVGYMNQPDEEG